MLGVHSLAPVKLTAGTTTVKTKPTIRRVVSKDFSETAPTAPVDTAPQADTSQGTTSPQPPMAEVREAPTHEPLAGKAEVEAVPNGAPHKPQEEVEPQTAQRLSVPVDADEAGPSIPVSQAEPAPFVNSQDEPDAMENRETAPETRPDETHANAISYRRDPETVISYLVPLPQPSIQGKTLQVPQKYFLYAPPPPHLVKPAHGSEGYALRLTRHWQQSVRRAKINAHNGKKVSWRGVRSKAVRGCVWGLNKLKYDDVAFLARIHPKTVTHLILIHPSDLSTIQSPEELLSTFRAQMFESKKRAKRNSIISAALFLPALAIDTAAVFFGGLAEIDGIWMLVSVTAYRTARLITQKMGPDPKTLEISQEKLIEDAKKLRPHPEKEESDDESETGAIRKSVDALRRGVGSVKHRMSLQGRRERKERKSESADRASTDVSRPQTRASQGFVGGELGDHAEEGATAADSTNANVAAGTNETTTTGRGEEGMSGVLEHSVEEEAPSADPSRPTGGIFQDDTAMSTNGSGDGLAVQNRGQNFQLTFYPSPAMESLDRYMQNTCHIYNGRAFSDTTAVPSEAEVLAVMGWSPERRTHLTAEQQQEDEEWQAREIEDDLRLVAAKAAKSWDKFCRKEAKRARRPMTAGAGAKIRFRRPQMMKGKAKQISPEASDVDLAKPGRTLGLKQRLGAMRKRSDKKEDEGTRNDHTKASGLKQRLGAMRKKSDKEKSEGTQRTSSIGGKAAGAAAGAAALLCIPCIAVSQRVQHRKQQREAGEEVVQEKKKKKKNRSTLKDRLAARKSAMRTKRTSQHDAESSATEAPTAHTLDQTTTDEEAPQGVTKQKKVKAGGILGGLTAVVMGIKAKMPKRKAKSTAMSEKPTKARKKGRFSALKERVKALRTRIVKRRKAKSGDETDREVDSPKTHSAMVGLVAGCLAMPGAKVKELREKHKANSNNSNNNNNKPSPGDDETPDMPTQLARSEQPGLTTQPPVPIPEEEEEEEEERDVAQALETQYLPGHGQSEIPVANNNNMEPPHGVEEQPQIPNAAGQPAASAPPPTSSSSSSTAAAAVKFRSIRDGMSNLTTRTRNSMGNADESTADREVADISSPLASPRGRFTFKTLRPGVKGRGGGGGGGGELQEPQPQQDDAHLVDLDAGIQPAAAANGGSNGVSTAEPTRTANGFGKLAQGLPFKRKGDVEGESTPTEKKKKQYKDRKPGFGDRMRVLWYMA